MASRRTDLVASFKVMDVLKKATEMEAMGREVLHLEVGQPKTGAPPSAVAAAQEALSKNLPLGYTEANGLLSLRKRISDYYAEKHGCDVDPSRVVVTTGSSSGFLLSFAALWSAGDAVAVPSTAYPCYRNVLRALECEPVEIKSAYGDEETGSRRGFTFPNGNDLAKLNADRKQEGLSPIKGLVLSSPSNPTGAMLTKTQLRDLAAACSKENVRFISDEIYQGITYGDDTGASAVDIENVVVVNSFSKFFSMTGWRVAWLVLPKNDPALADAVTRLHQNLAICAPAISQVAAEASFDDLETTLASHVAHYAENRRIVLQGLAAVGIDIDKHVAPANGAFYVYADLRHYGLTDSRKFCDRLLRDTGVAIAPGSDFEFDSYQGDRRLRFSYCGDSHTIREAMARLKEWWGTDKLE